MRHPVAASAMIVAAFLASRLPPAAIAQEPAPAKSSVGQAAPSDAAVPAAPTRDRLEVMKEELALTPEQIEKIKPIVDRDKTRSRQLVADKSLSQADRQKKLNAMMKASLDEIFPHLTPEQQAKWKEYKSKQRAAREKK
jgi:Spy/CpxP family protein refolding chaperone